VYGRTVKMNPLVTIVSLLVGAELLGSSALAGDPGGGRDSDHPAWLVVRAQAAHDKGCRR
jgi:hypothetical protein